MWEYSMDWISQRADRTSEKTALIDPDNNREFTYREFDVRSSRVASFLRDELDIGAGERVALLTKNGPHYFEVIYGCAKGDTRYVGLNWRLTASELEHHLTDAAPSVLVYDPAFDETVEELRSHDIVDHFVSMGDPLAGSDWTYEEALAAGSGERISNHERPRDDIWGLLYTSGTTGLPKGVKQTFDMVLYNYLNIGPLVNLTSDDTFLTVLPLFHTGGLNLYANPTLIVGGTVIIPEAFDPEQTLELLEEEANVFFGVPAIYKALIEHPEFESYDLSGVRSWGSGGARLSESLIERYAEHDITIRQGYGMTETGPTVFLIEEDQALDRAGSVGKPAPFVDMDIVDQEAMSVDEGEEGELVIRGPGVTPGYWENEAATEEAFEDGWLHTGDIATRDEDGYVYIVDRLKNMFISGGENVYPAEIERVLHQHDDIDEAVVVAIEDEQWGEVGRAFIVGADDLSEADVTEYCSENLAGYKVPKEVVFLDEMPRGPTGNVERGRLKEY